MSHYNYNRSLITNIAAVIIILVGLFIADTLGKIVLNVGLFALSGGLTNWLAIHMLFEKVPGFYGSGVVQLHFEDFKKAIHDLIMNQFFTKENVYQFFDKNVELEEHMDISFIRENIDYEKSFKYLTDMIMNSSFGNMLDMFGGPEALEPLKDPFKEKIGDLISDIVDNPKIREKLKEKMKDHASPEKILEKVSQIVRKRLDELTPKKVKEIIHEMIQQHLGWLVIWGGFFGGIIGLITGLIQFL